MDCTIRAYMPENDSPPGNLNPTGVSLGSSSTRGAFIGFLTSPQVHISEVALEVACRTYSQADRGSGQSRCTTSLGCARARALAAAIRGPGPSAGAQAADARRKARACSRPGVGQGAAQAAPAWEHLAGARGDAMPDGEHRRRWGRLGLSCGRHLGFANLNVFSGAEPPSGCGCAAGHSPGAGARRSPPAGPAATVWSGGGEEVAVTRQESNAGRKSHWARQNSWLRRSGSRRSSLSAWHPQRPGGNRLRRVFTGDRSG